ncbi:MAG: hypothetical protein MRZ79_24355 [Bacteroidia bacterium]|nr:hypothetical protein [Bacteroidia bacterium]
MARISTYIHPPIINEDWLRLSSEQEQSLNDIIFSLIEKLEINKDYESLAAIGNKFYLWDNGQKSLFFTSLFGLLENASRGGNGHGSYPNSAKSHFRHDIQKRFNQSLKIRPFQAIFVPFEHQGIEFCFFFFELIFFQMSESFGKQQNSLVRFQSKLLGLRHLHDKLITEGKNPTYVEESVFLEFEKLMEEIYGWLSINLGQEKTMKYLGRSCSTMEHYYSTFPAFKWILQLLPRSMHSPSRVFLLNTLED